MTQRVVQVDRRAILVIDDSEANLLAYRATLEPLGLEIVTATSGQAAVELFFKREFGLLLIDVRMPGLDGFDTVDQMRKQLRRDTPVIFVTGAVGDEDSMRRAYDFGAVDYLVKPVHPYVLAGKVRNLLAFYEQGVELERRAALLHAKEAALEVAQAESRKKDTNMAILAHDLRNPLGAIVTGTQLMQALPGLPDRAKSVAERIERSANRMTLMVRDLLDFSQGELAGGVAVHPRTADLAAILSGIVDEIRGAYPNVNIETRVAGELTGYWDPARLEQVLSNLLANAVNHGDKNVCVSLSGHPNEVTIEVRNEGPPIPPEQMSTLFEAFRKGDRSSGGLGLGLFIVRGIVRAHRGAIDVTSTSSEGTRFILRLPRQWSTQSGDHAEQSGGST